MVRKNDSTIPRAGMPPADAASFRRYRSSHERTTAMERCQVWNCTWDEMDKVRDSVRHKLLRPSGQFASEEMVFKDLKVSEGEELMYWMFTSYKNIGQIEWADLVSEVMADFLEYFAPDPMPMEPEMTTNGNTSHPLPILPYHLLSPSFHHRFGFQMPEDYDPEPKRIARILYDIRLKAIRDLFAMESQDLKTTPFLRDETTLDHKRHVASLLPGPHPSAPRTPGRSARTKNAAVKKIYRNTRRLIVRKATTHSPNGKEEFFTERLTSLLSDDTGNLKNLTSIELTRVGAEIVARKWTDPVDEFWLCYKRRSDGKELAITNDLELGMSLVDTEEEKGKVWEIEVRSGELGEEVAGRSWVN